MGIPASRLSCCRRHISRIMPVQRHQLGMAAALHHLAAVQYDDLVGVDDGGEPVRDDQGGHVAADLEETGLDLLFGVAIERRGGLVEEEDTGPFEERAGDGDALFLAARELQPSLADHSLIAFRQARDEVVDLRHAGRFLDLLAAGLRPAVADVIEDRVVEQDGVLRDDADGRTQAVLGHLADVLTVDLDIAGIQVVEAEQQPADGGFAGAGMTDDGDRPSGRHVEGDALQDRPPLIVTEADILEGDAGPGNVERRRVRWVAHLGGDVQELGTCSPYRPATA